jgi:PleD family two-component response regulator
VVKPKRASLTCVIVLPLFEPPFPPLNISPDFHQERQFSSTDRLLVDDDPTVIEVTEEILCILGHCVIVASDGNEALHRYNNHQGMVDLVITDLAMPGMDGRALIPEPRG